jgi:aldehyde:ferredoxin oxidoreductase
VLKWGAAEDLTVLLHQMATGEGFGRFAGRGTRKLKGWIAERHAGRTGRNADEIRKELGWFAMECKGLEFSVYVTKESLAQQGGYGFALKGAQHDEAWLIAVDQIKGEMPSFEEKARALRWFPLFRTWFNIVGLCKLPWIDVRHPEAGKTPEPAKNLPSIEYYLEMVNSTLGTQKTLEDLIFESERLYTFQKLFNLRQGKGTRRHDRIPLRAMAPVFENEYESRMELYDNQLRQAGETIDGLSLPEKLRLLQEHRREQFEHLCDAVYREKGYDAEGIPLQSTLKRFGLDSPEFLSLIEEAAGISPPAFLAATRS